MILALETAKEWGKPPSMFLGGGAGEWTIRDSIAALGYQLYQRTLCPECGQTMEKCRGAANDGWYEVESDVCFAKKAIVEHQNTEGYQPEPGELLYPVRTQPANNGAGYGAAPW